VNDARELKGRKLARTIGRLAALLALVLAGTATLPAQEYKGDLLCGKTTRFTTPGECLNSCSQQRRTLANLGGVCSFSSSCPAYGQEPHSALPQFYNQALFGRGAVVGAEGKLVLASHIINTYYPPNNARQISVIINPTKGGGEFAHVEPSATPGGKQTLTLRDDVFYTAPGYMISVIGHEMVHVEQNNRSQKTNQMGISSLVGAMHELEASSWEIHADNFPRSIGPSKVGNCMRDQEKTAQQQTYACRQWQVKQAIEDILRGPRKDAYSRSVGLWLNEDPWASQVWLPANPSWQTQAAGQKPFADCKNP